MSINMTLIGQMITFAIFVWFTMKYVWPPLKVAMDDRKKKISDGLMAADQAAKELEIAERKSLEIIQNAKSQAAIIVEQANERAHRIEEESKADAKVAANRIKESATAEMLSEKNRLKDELRKEVSEIALAGVEKIIGSTLSKDSNDKLLAKLVNDI